MTDSAFTKLRAANPVPSPVAVDAPELYASITARPAGVRERRRVSRLAIAVVVIVAVAAVLATGAVSGWFGTVVTPDVTLREYTDAQRELSLPPGAHWPTLHVEPNSVTTRGGGGGYAVAVAMNRWECAWADAIRAGDARASQRARATLDALLARNVLVAPVDAPEDWQPATPPTVPYMVFAHDGGYERKQRIYAAAARGDATGVAASCSANA